MRVLLDTHILLWSVAQSDLLPRAVANTLADSSNTVYFSVINLWELVIKAALQRPDFRVDSVRTRQEALGFGFRELQVTAEHAFAVAFLPALHRDPFDRMLIAQARTEGLQLLTMDSQVQQYFPR